MLSKFIEQYDNIYGSGSFDKIPLRWKRIITEEVDKTDNYDIFLKNVFAKIEELDMDDYLRFNMP